MDEYGETARFRDPRTGAITDVPPPGLGDNGGPPIEDEDPGPDTLDEEEVASWLHARISNATNQDSDEVSSERQEALNYYLGRPYGDEMEGYSKVVTRDVFELVEWALASMVRIFLSAPRIVEFKPTGEEDVPQAHLETEALHDYLDGSFIQLMCWVRDAFLYPNAYLKVWHEDVPKSETHTYNNLAMPQVGLLTQDPEVEVEWYSEGDVPGTVTLGIRRTKVAGEIKLEAVPPEEVLILTEEATSLSLSDLDYAHAREVAKYELVEMGYEEEWVRGLPSSTDHQDASERTNRQQGTADTLGGDSVLDMHETVDYYECHVTLDWDNDGYAERRKICCIGSGSSVEIVENERDDAPECMCTLSTVPQPHRHVGVSLADSGKWIQRVSSVLTRQLLDNLYRTNRPRQFAGPGTNLEQLESYVPHGVVEVRDPSMVREEVITTVVDKVLPVLKHFDEEKEAGSGVSRHTMGLDAERLQDTTMGAYVNALGQASQRLEMIARTFAETGFSELAKATHYLMRTHQDTAQMMKLGGEWQSINPATWRTEREVKACVGLGYGTSQERVASGMALLDVQKEAMAAGLSTKGRIYRNLEDIVRAMGKREPGMYFLDPESDEGEKVAEGMAKQQQAQQAKQDKLLDLAAGQETKKETIKLAELRAEIEKDQRRHLEALAKLELEYGVDIAGMGLDPETLRPMNVGDNDA